MAREKFRDKPFYYKFLSATLRMASAMLILLVIYFAVIFFTEIPFYRMFEGITVAQIIMMIMVLLAVICQFMAWKNSMAGGIATLFPTIAYTVIESLENQAYTAGPLNYIMLTMALMFIIQGIMKKRIEFDKMEDILGPKKMDDSEGPNLMDLHL